MIVAMVLLMSVSCYNEPYIVGNMQFDRKVYEISNRGGEITIDFSINGVGSSEVPSVITDFWMEVIDVSSTHATIAIDKNFGNKREGSVVFRLRNGREAVIEVHQKAYNKNRELISLQISELTPRQCRTRAEAREDNVVVITYMTSDEYFVEDVEWDMDYMVRGIMSDYIRAAEQNDMTFMEYIEDRGYGGEGVVSHTWEGLFTAHKMYFAAFGISWDEAEGDYELLTPLYHKSFDVPLVQKHNITFTTRYEVESNYLNLHIEPNNWLGYYRVNVVSVDGGDNYIYPDEPLSAEELRRRRAADFFQLYYRRVELDGYSVEEFLSTYCSTGVLDEQLSLWACKDYSVDVSAVEVVDGVPQIVSDVYLSHITTSTVEPSDLAFEVEMHELSAWLAHYTIKPSNGDECYTGGIVESSSIANVRDEDLIATLVCYDDPRYSLYGDFEVESYILKPETEYTIFAVGCRGGVATTDLMKYRFTTPAAEPSAVSIESIEWHGPYAYRDIYNYDNGYFGNYDWEGYEALGYTALWYDIKVNGPYRMIFSHIYNVEDIENTSKERALDYLYTMRCDSRLFYNATYGDESVIWAVVMDEHGNLSELFSTEPFVLRPEDNRDVEEFFEAKNATRSGSSALHMAGIATDSTDEDTIPIRLFERR